MRTMTQGSDPTLNPDMSCCTSGAQNTRTAGPKCLGGKGPGLLGTPSLLHFPVTLALPFVGLRSIAQPWDPTSSSRQLVIPLSPAFRIHLPTKPRQMLRLSASAPGRVQTTLSPVTSQEPSACHQDSSRPFLNKQADAECRYGFSLPHGIIWLFLCMPACPGIKCIPFPANPHRACLHTVEHLQQMGPSLTSHPQPGVPQRREATWVAAKGCQGATQAQKLPTSPTCLQEVELWPKTQPHHGVNLAKSVITSRSLCRRAW